MTRCKYRVLKELQHHETNVRMKSSCGCWSLEIQSVYPIMSQILYDEPTQWRNETRRSESFCSNSTTAICD